MKNKFTRDLATLERNMDDKIKRNQKNVDENAEAFETKVDAMLEMFKDKIKDIETKMSTVEPSEVVYTFVRDLNATSVKALETATTE